MFSLAIVGRAIATPGAKRKGKAQVSWGKVAKGLEKSRFKRFKDILRYVKMFRHGLRWLKMT
jgi:hypothetical protein